MLMNNTEEINLNKKLQLSSRLEIYFCNMHMKQIHIVILFAPTCDKWHILFRYSNQHIIIIS
jgi:hypothetical protein